MSLGEHLEELRMRLILAIAGIFCGMVVCMCFGKYLVTLLRLPYDRTMASLELSNKLVAIHPAEGFLVYIKTSLIFGLLLTCPWVFWQIWAFVASGLYKKEKKFAYSVAPVSAALFICGGIFFMTKVAPLTMAFFVKFNKYLLDVQSMFTLANYINLVLVLTLVFGLAFQMPIIVVFAERMGLVTIEILTKNRKFVILALVIISAIVTPPDIISQIALAGPLYVLYEGSIIFCRITAGRRKKNTTPLRSL